MRTWLPAAALALAGLGGPACAAAPQEVQLPPAGLSSALLPLRAHLYEPAGAGPFPAVVMLHGCGGAYARQGGLNARQAMWGEWLAAHGHVALLVDSFGARGLAELCTQRAAERPVQEDDRVGDAHAALAWLRQRANVDGRRVALLGWSHGGGVTLSAIGGAAAAPPATGGFSAAVAFYPGCTRFARRADAFHPQAPLLVLIGEADDWTPAAPCRQLAAAVAARGEPMQLVTFPDTFHDFDNPALKAPRHRADVPGGVRPGTGVTTAPNAAAREAAKAQVLHFLQAHLR